MAELESFSHSRIHMYKLYIKRTLDFLISLLIILFILPLLFIICILLYFQNNGTPFFFQKRPGKDAKPFKIIKFKTMTDEKDTNGNLLPDNERITSLGSFIRKWSLD